MKKSLTLVKQSYVFLILILFSNICYAWPPTYGAEFEFTTAELSNNSFHGLNPSETSEKKAQIKFKDAVTKMCLSANCRVFEVTGKWDIDYTVMFDDKFWFKISYDPSCVEITFKPSTLQTLSDQAIRINESIFKVAKNSGFHINSKNSAHFNIGIRSAFKDNALNFIRFFVDYSNRPDLGSGSLGHDLYNAPPLSMLYESQRNALASIVQKTESGQYKTIQEVVTAIQDEVYTKSYDSSWGGQNHYQAISLKYAYQANLNLKDAPFEIRAMWSQHSAEHFNLIAELMEGRFDYLNQSTDPIIYNMSMESGFSDSQLKTRFFIYVEEAGLSYAKFESLIPKNVRNASFSAFLNKDASFKQRLSDVFSYLPLVSSSPFVRNQIIKILSDPEAYESENFKITKVIISKIKKLQMNYQENLLQLNTYELFYERLSKLFKTQKSKIEYTDIFSNLLKDIDSRKHEKNNKLQTKILAPVSQQRQAGFQSQCIALFN